MTYNMLDKDKLNKYTPCGKETKTTLYTGQTTVRARYIKNIFRKLTR